MQEAWKEESATCYVVKKNEARIESVSQIVNPKGGVCV